MGSLSVSLGRAGGVSHPAASEPGLAYAIGFSRCIATAPDPSATYPTFHQSISPFVGYGDGYEMGTEMTPMKGGRRVVTSQFVQWVCSQGLSAWFFVRRIIPDDCG
jgi:hypothetical protein